MSYESLSVPANAASEVGIYECEVNLKFRMIEEKGVLKNRDQLLEVLLEAFGYGNDEYLEATQVQVSANELAETEASPALRRQLMRLRNSREYGAG
ncbi:MAG: Npun_R1517 family heterocyst differentiation transcriptional regulator [Synechococcales cyanobacterium RM1_1_8]|nr:Npun_R1517 family heterocyst differentiation transcriptional regulator [Synechococcales cyanobacterium RM1_1_8]